jgi:hypothetical protein
MKAFALLGAVGAMTVLAASSCSLFTGTVSGAITGDYWVISKPVTVELTKDGKAISSTATLDIGDPTQTGFYLVSGAMSGNYSLVVTFETDNAWSPVSPATYSIVGGAQGVEADDDQYTDTSPSTHTLTWDAVPVEKDSTINIYLGDGG